MWRAFVYQASSPTGHVRHTRSLCLSMGNSVKTMLCKMKNGPIDFQPREPFSPLFGAMQHTQVMPEFQITQEYLGQSIHTVFLPTMWKACLDAETYRDGGGTVAEVTQHRVGIHSWSAMAGVANIGDVVNWTGSDMAQANWYAFGRLCWNTELSAAQIAEEFLKQTFSTDEYFVEPVRQLLLRSWDTAVSYMMPLGLHHIFAFGHHYGLSHGVLLRIPVRIGCRSTTIGRFDRDWFRPYGTGFESSTTVL